MKRSLPLTILRSSLVVTLATAPVVAQTPVRDRMPAAPVETPQLFIPGQAPVAGTPANTATAAGTPVSPATSGVQDEAAEKRFLEAVYSADMRELGLARLAASQSQDPAVRTMAQAIVNQYTARMGALASLKTLAGERIPEAENAAAGAVERLRTLKGAEFDTAFLKELQRERVAKLARYEAARRETTDAGLQHSIDALLPAVRTEAQTTSSTPVQTSPVADPGAVTGLPPDTLPVSIPANLPNPVGGSLPSAIPGNVPNPTGGSLPSATPGTLPSAIPGNLPNPAGGVLPNPGTGPLPNALPGTLPSMPGNPLPNPAAGTLPSAIPGNLPNPAAGPLPSLNPLPKAPASTGITRPVPPPVQNPRYRPAGRPAAVPAHR